MSQKGACAEAFVIQAIADAFHLTINIVESNQVFAPHTVFSPQQLYQDMNLLLKILDTWTRYIMYELSPIMIRW